LETSSDRGLTTWLLTNSVSADRGTKCRRPERQAGNCPRRAAWQVAVLLMPS